MEWKYKVRENGKVSQVWIVFMVGQQASLHSHQYESLNAHVTQQCELVRPNQWLHLKYWEKKIPSCPHVPPSHAPTGT